MGIYYLDMQDPGVSDLDFIAPHLVNISSEEQKASLPLVFINRQLASIGEFSFVGITTQLKQIIGK